MEVCGRKETTAGCSGQSGILCQPCQGDGDTVSAEGFCETCNEFICTSCIKAHRKLAGTKNHVIKSKDEMPGVHIQTDPCTELCAIHKSEIVKYYCQSHDIVGCGDCMVLEHKACKVQLVADVSSNYGNSGELSRIKRKIEKIRKDITSYRKDMQFNVKAATEMNMKVIQEIKTFRKEVNSYLDTAESALLKEFEELKCKDVLHQVKLQDECETVEKEINEFQNKLESSSDKINQLFVTAKREQKRLQIWQELIQRTAAECHVTSHTFNPSEDLRKLHKTLPPFGYIQSIKRNLTSQSKKSIVDMNAQFVGEVSVEASDDEDDWWITGLASISSNEILLADWRNITLKILNIKECKITSTYETSSSPWGVTTINAETAAATLPGLGTILFVNVKDGLSKNRSLKVRKECRGIDHHNDELVVSFVRPPAVQVLSMKGTIQHEVRDTSIFDSPGYIVLSNDNKSIFVSDDERDAVFELTKDEHIKVKMTYKDLKWARGLAVTNDGTIIVCSEGKSDMVSMIVPGSSEVLPLDVQHLQNPSSIIVCEEQKRMYICEVGNPNIKIFELI